MTSPAMGTIPGINFIFNLLKNIVNSYRVGSYATMIFQQNNNKINTDNK